MHPLFRALLFALFLSPAFASPSVATPKPGILTKVRFYPMPGYERAVVGGRILGSNDPSLPNVESQGSDLSLDTFKVLGEISSAPVPGQWGELAIENNPTPYRWLVYAAPPGSHGKIAEVEFYSGAKKLTGWAINAFSPHGAWRYATDGNIKSYYNGEKPDGQFAGLDIGTEATGPSPTASPVEGEYVAPTNVTLACKTPGAVIRYTLDGTKPTAGSGELYTGPIPISKTSTITAIAFTEGLAPTPPLFSTYIIGKGRHTATFQIGNSLTQLGGYFSRQSITAGHVDQQVIWGIGGATTKRLWEGAMTPEVNPSLYSDPHGRWLKQWPSLTNIDFFTMQPRDFDVAQEVAYEVRWLNFVRQKAPNVQPWLYIEWTEMARKRPTDLGTQPTSEMRKVWPAATWEESMAAMVLYGEDLERALKETYKQGKTPRVLPTALAMGWFHHQVVTGQFPGVDPGDFYTHFFADDVHTNTEGAFLVVSTWYAALFGESPEGKMLPIHTNLTTAQALAIERLAWDAVQNYPDCGYYKEGTTPVGQPQFSSGSPAQDITPVTLTSSTPGAWFRYTLDGTTPTRTNGYIFCGVVSARPGMTIKAIAYKSGMAESPVAEMTYPAEKTAY